MAGLLSSVFNNDRETTEFTVDLGTDGQLGSLCKLSVNDRHVTYVTSYLPIPRKPVYVVCSNTGRLRPVHTNGEQHEEIIICEDADDPEQTMRFERATGNRFDSGICKTPSEG